MMMVGGSGTHQGAVNSPVEVMLPHASPVQPGPDTLQVTLWSERPTSAVNCCVAATFTLAVDGLTLTAGSSVISACPDLLRSAIEVAKTVTVVVAAISAGA